VTALLAIRWTASAATSARRFEPDPGATSDHHDGLAEERRLVAEVRSDRLAGHGSSDSELAELVTVEPGARKGQVATVARCVDPIDVRKAADASRSRHGRETSAAASGSRLRSLGSGPPRRGPVGPPRPGAEGDAAQLEAPPGVEGVERYGT
jgi:hypothetical protein